MKTLLFASHNINKVLEIQSALHGKYRIKSLLDINFKGELAEPYTTFDENAKHKAQQGYALFGLPCFAEDAGLAVDALDGRPGVLSARYAGPDKDPKANIDKVLNELIGIENRNAYFIAVIAFYNGHDYHLFEGRVYGSILNQSTGSGGFGYDPVFQPNGFTESFGELGLDVKNRISHRALAIEKFVDYFRNSDSIDSHKSIK